jgi:hypothetical protein
VVFGSRLAGASPPQARCGVDPKIGAKEKATAVNFTRVMVVLGIVTLIAAAFVIAEKLGKLMP